MRSGREKKAMQADSSGSSVDQLPGALRAGGLQNVVFLLGRINEKWADKPIFLLLKRFDQQT
jgi:hypothetical protein